MRATVTFAGFLLVYGAAQRANLSQVEAEALACSSVVATVMPNLLRPSTWKVCQAGLGRTCQLR